MSHLRLVASQPRDRRTQGEHPCLEAFKSEFDYLIRSLRRLGVHADDVEDVAHEVFLVLHQSWAKYDQTRPFRAYLFGVAFRVAANHTRKRRKETPFAFVDADDMGPRPDQVFELNQRRALVLRALSQLPLDKRAVLIMHDIDGLEMTEIARALSIYRFTGYSRLRKARVEFAAAVKRLFGASEP
jgi:RNA polymerase sigma-70 factor (ECF subfamily)